MSDEPASVAEEVDPLTLFPEEWRQPVEGLMYLGQLSETIEFCGHTFGLRTLLPQDKFAISSVIQPYRNTIMEVDVYQAAHVAAGLTAVDGDENFCPPIGADINAFLQGRLNYIAKRLYPPTIEFLWTRQQLLEATAAQAIKEMDRLLRGSQPITLPPWLDSLTEQGSSPDETDSATQPSTPSSSG